MASPAFISAWLLGAALLAAAPDAKDARPPLTEAEQDRVRAASRFALAKTLYEQGDLPASLRAYQRAYWWDPSQEAPLKEIVPLAASLGQEAVAIRYALIQAEQHNASPEMLRRLALYATQQQQWDQAARLYDMWLSAAPDRHDPFQRALIQLERGRIAMLAGDPAEASRLFGSPQRALLDRPASPLARRLTTALGGSLGGTLENLAQCHLSAGEEALAAQAIEALAESVGETRVANYWQARLALARSQPLDALESLREYYDQSGDPLGDLPYDALRQAMIRLNESDRLTAEMNRLHAQRPASPYPLAILARRHASRGELNEARDLYEQLIGGASPNSPIEITRSLFQEAGVWLLNDLVRQSQFDGVLPLLTRLSQTDPNLVLFSDELSRLTGSPAISDHLSMRLKLAAERDPIAGQDLAVCRVALITGEHKLGVEFLKKSAANRTEDTPDVVRNFAVDLLLEDQPEHALDVFQWGMDQGLLPKDEAVLWYYVSTSRALLDQTDGALEAARRAIELAPTSAQFASQPAWVCLRAEQKQRAAEEYERLLADFEKDNDPATRETLRGARMSLSYLVLQQGDTQRSTELVLEVLDEFPHDVGALNDLGYQWADRGVHLERALRMIQRAVAAEPANPAYQDSLGWVCYRLGRNQEGLEAIERALALQQQAGDKADAEILSHHGDLLLATGRAQDARRAWQEALSRLDAEDEDNAQRETLREKLAGLPSGQPSGEDGTHQPNQQEQAKQ